MKQKVVIILSSRDAENAVRFLHSVYHNRRDVIIRLEEDDPSPDDIESGVPGGSTVGLKELELAE